MKPRILVTVILLLAVFVSACTPAPQAVAPQVATTQAPASQQLPQTGSTPTAQAAAPQAAAPAAPAAAPDPSKLTAVAKAYIETVNNGDFEKALDFYAPDAVVVNPLGLFIGKDQVAAWLKQDVQTTRAQSQDYSMAGPLVVVTGKVSLARFKQAGIDLVDFRSEYLIGPDGKIHFFSPAVMLTPDQQARMKASAGAPPAPATDPISVVKAYVEAANQGDFEKALSFYADQSAALVMNGTRLLSNRQAITEWLKQDVQATRATPQEWQANGNTVINTGMVSLARLKALGIDSVPYRAVYLVENGKIRFFSPRLILSPEQQAIIAKAQPKP